MQKRRRKPPSAKAKQAEARAIWRKLRRDGWATPIAKALGLTPQAVFQWREVPIKRVVAVEEIVGMPRHLLRPDEHLPPNGSQKKDDHIAA
jgi:DNA-binding transcriptional regulator YdaS (Cro superfamily)